jgi:DNA-directed RNA polymerase specialized sigma24 family protein
MLPCYLKRGRIFLEGTRHGVLLSIQSQRRDPANPGLAVSGLECGAADFDESLSEKEDKPMSATADDVLPLVPRLRRLAFLLTGSKEVGDDHVRLCLELVMAEPERLEGEDLHVAVFRAFHAANRTIETVDEPIGRLTGGFRERVRSAFGHLPLPERRAIALLVVEEFSLEQTAQILNMHGDKVRQMLTDAHCHLEALVARSVLITEDEPLIAKIPRAQPTPG